VDAISTTKVRDYAAPKPINMEQEEAIEPQENIQNTPDQDYTFKERNKSRKITRLVVEGREITDQEEIIQVMQSWYEDTATLQN